MALGLVLALPPSMQGTLARRPFADMRGRYDWSMLSEEFREHHPPQQNRLRSPRFRSVECLGG